MIKIKQIVISKWLGSDGKEREDVLGLGDDELMYRWHLGTGKWILYVINK